MATMSHRSPATTQAGLSHLGRPVTMYQGGVLRSFGIDMADLAADTVTIQTKAFRRLLSELARQQPFDPEFYAETYPDIEAARLAGLVDDLHSHFIEVGFFEGRLPVQPPFDPEWYAAYYPDLAEVFAPGDTAGLRNHFLSAGLAEGRAGTKASLARTLR